MESELVPVTGVPCPCAGTPHAEGDTVSLYPRLNLHDGVVAQRKIITAMEGKADSDEVIATLMDIYCRKGVAAWTFLDDDGKPLPVSQEAIELKLLGNFAVGMVVADKADNLYSPGLIDPLRSGIERSLQPSQTNGSTYPKTRSSARPRKR